MGRRKFYARDRSGRFARTTGSKGVYRKKASTRRKVAYAAGAVAIAGGAALGGRELYRAGGRKGFEYGKAQGIKQGAPLRGRKGKFLPDDLKRDYSQNPYARGFRPVGKEGRARKAPKLRTVGDRVRQATRIRERKLTGEKGRKEGRIRRQVTRRTDQFRKDGPQRRERARARRYDRAQRASQVRGRASNRARRSTQNAATNLFVGAQLAGRKARRRK